MAGVTRERQHLAGSLAEGLGLLGALALAACLRLGWAGTNSFSFDEPRVSLMALEMARHGQFAVLGMQSSTGLPNLPGAVWLFALPYLFSSDPLVATLLVGVLGILAVLGVWWLARCAWGPWAALSAALALAGSPYAVLYARGIWGQDLLPPLAVLWAVAGVYGISRDKPWALACHIFLAGFAFQVHYAGLTLLPASAWLVLRFRLWRRWPALLLGGGLAALCVWPFAHIVWCCAPGIRATLRTLWRQPAQTDLAAWQQWLHMGAGAHWEWLLLGRWPWPRALALMMGASNVVLAALGLGGLAAMLGGLWRERCADGRDPRTVLAALLPAWALAAPLLFTRHSTPSYHQYQLAALPAFFLAVGAVAGLTRRRAWGATVSALLLGAALVQALALAQGLDLVTTRLVPGGLGAPLLYPRNVARALQDGGRIVVHAHSDQADVEGDPAAFHVLLWDYPHQVVDGRAALLIPARGAGQPAPHLLMTFADLPAWGEALASGLRGEARTYPRREGEPPFMTLTLSDTNLPGFVPVGPLTLANGARLQGWRVQSVEGGFRVTCLWRIAAPPPEGAARYHQFNHLRVGRADAPDSPAAGEPLAIHDMPVSSPAWQQGDTLLTWADFASPAQPGPYWLDVGMYTYPQMQRSPVLGRSGDPLAPIRLGPFDRPGP